MAIEDVSVVDKEIKSEENLENGVLQSIENPNRVRKFYKSLKKHKAYLLDFYSRIVFPFAFLIFNIVFWGVIYT